MFNGCMLRRKNTKQFTIEIIATIEMTTTIEVPSTIEITTTIE